MPTLTLDHHTVTVPEGATVLDAATQAGIAIPTLCHRPDLPSLAGCMICAVRDETSGRLIPSCATPAAEGMRIATASPDVIESRRALLELLLSNHAADCEGPCQLACPCHFDIPTMLAHLAAGRGDEALATVLERLALPVTLGHICPAPCEKVCRRGALDAPVAICAAKRFAGEGGKFAPARQPATGKRVLVIGSGPTGLSAAFHLQRMGHTCHIVEAQQAPGAALLAQVAPRLPADALERDVARLRALGVTWSLGQPATPDGMAAHLAACDGLVLAAGAASAALAAALGAVVAKGLVVADKVTHQTANPKVFAGGAAIQPCRIAVLACAHGRAVAEQLDAWLRTGHVPPRTHEPFHSRAGKLGPDMLQGLLADVGKGPRRLPPAGGRQPESLERATIGAEAGRCLRCDCFKQHGCHFRSLCRQCHATGSALHGGRTHPGRIHAQPDVVVELAKCVLCGICVREAAKRGAVCGPAFHGRGFDMTIGPPIGREWADIPREILLACVDACPTGALARVPGRVPKLAPGVPP